MKVNLNGKRYEFEFQHSQYVEGGSYKLAPTRFTHEEVRHASTVAKVFENVGDERVFVDWAEAICSPGDHFSKSYGRRKSLTRLLTKNFNKKEREIVWTKYFAEHKDIEKKFR